MFLSFLFNHLCAQVLYVPRHWWHYVESVDPITVSVNSWIELVSSPITSVSYQSPQKSQKQSSEETAHCVPEELLLILIRETSVQASLLFLSNMQAWLYKSPCHYDEFVCSTTSACCKLIVYSKTGPLTLSNFPWKVTDRRDCSKPPDTECNYVDVRHSFLGCLLLCFCIGGRRRGES